MRSLVSDYGVVKTNISKNRNSSFKEVVMATKHFSCLGVIISMFICVMGIQTAWADEAQSYYGIIPPADANSIITLYAAPMVGQTTSFSGVSSLTSQPLTSYVFTTADLVFFSYEDGTQLEVYDSSGNPVSFTPNLLDKGEHVYVDTSIGVYLVAGSKKFSVLTGDATDTENGGVSGYYAMDADGYGLSQEFYTYAPRIYDHCEFIVFSHEDNTVVTVQQDLSNGVYSGLASFTLDKGQHWSRSDIDNKYLHVTANKPVSALTCYDQSYFVPSSDGHWNGYEFYTYVNDIGNGSNVWPEDLTVIAYEDDTSVTIKDSDTQEILLQETFDSGQARYLSYANGADKYITVTADQVVAVSVQPWQASTSNYYQGVFVPDRDGIAIGTEFIGTTQDSGYLNVLAYSDDTEVNIYNSQTGIWQADYTLDEGEIVNANPGNGLWRVESNKPVSVYSGWGDSPIADFAPLEFNQNFLQLTKVDDVNELTDCRGIYESIEYTIEWNNTDGEAIANAYIIDRLPQGVDYDNLISVNPLILDPNYNSTNHTYRWDIGDIAVDETGDVTLTVTVNEIAEPGLELYNTAELWGTVNDVNMLLGRAYEVTPICCWDTTDPNIIYVDRNAHGNNTGVDWTNAYTDLQDALYRAENVICGAPYRIYVAQGKYSPGVNSTDSFVLPEGISLYGGFMSGGCDFEYRNPDRYQTVLTAAIDPNVQNDTVVIMLDDIEIEETTLLDGFIVTDAMEYGIYGSGVDFTVENCIVEDGEQYGLYAKNGNVSVDWSKIQYNQQHGIYHVGSNFNLIIENSHINNNRRHGVYSLNSTPDIKNCVVFKNGFYEDGYNGINILLPSSIATLYNNTIIGNKKAGISYFDSDPNYLQIPDYIDLQNCIVWYNNDGDSQVSGLNPDNTAYYCCIQDCNDVTGRYNINDEPGFAYTTEPNNIPDPNNPYHLAWNSPCQGAGNPSFDNDDAGLYDIDAEDRISYGRIDIGADEVYSCSENNNVDIYNALDWNADGLLNLEEFTPFAQAWLSHDPNDPAFDPNDVSYNPNLSDPNHADYISPAQKAAWNPTCNLIDSGDSAYSIDLVDMMDFIENQWWLWTACWKYSQMHRFDNMAAAIMSGDGGGESMMMAVPMAMELMSMDTSEQTSVDTELDEYSQMTIPERASLVVGIHDIIDILEISIEEEHENAENLYEAIEFLEDVLSDIAASRE